MFGRTDVGQIREHNEDNFLVADLTRKSRSLMEADRQQDVGERGTVLGVCDGMGGAAAGEVASQLAVDIIYEKLAQGEPPVNRDELAIAHPERHVPYGHRVAVRDLEALDLKHRSSPGRRGRRPGLA